MSSLATVKTLLANGVVTTAFPLRFYCFADLMHLCIEPGHSLLTISTAFKELYEKDLALLINSISTPQAPSDKITVARKLYESNTLAELIEVDRTLMGVYLYYLVLTNDYDRFVECQGSDNPVRLTPQSFNELFMLITSVVQAETAQSFVETVFGYDIFMAYSGIHDLGKSRTFLDIARNGDHDSVLAYIVEYNPEMIDSWGTLSIPARRNLKKLFGTAYSLAQLPQGENTAYDLWKSGIERLDSYELNMYLAHSILDIAAAAGHIFQNGSKVLDNNVWTGFKQAIITLRAFRESDGSALSAQKIHIDYLQTRSSIAAGETIQFSPVESDLFSYEITEARLLCMNRFYLLEEAQSLRQALATAPAEIVTSVVQLLRGLGIDDQGVLAYYGPQIIENTKRWAAKNNVGIAEIHQTVLGIFANVSNQLDWSMIPIGRTTLDLTAVATLCITDPTAAIAQQWIVSEIIDNSIKFTK